MRIQLKRNGIQALTEQYQQEQEQIQVLQTNVDLLRKKYKINRNDEANFGVPSGFTALKSDEVSEHQEEFERTQPFWDEKRKLVSMTEFHKFLAAKIESEKLDLQIPETSLV